jgi:hypothetical protein
MIELTLLFESERLLTLLFSLLRSIAPRTMLRES